jgi:ATP/ADP translocase
LTATTLALARFLSTTLATAAGLFAAAFALVTLVLFPVCHLLTLPCSLTSNDASCLIKQLFAPANAFFQNKKF